MGRDVSDTARGCGGVRAVAGVRQTGDCSSSHPRLFAANEICS